MKNSVLLISGVQQSDDVMRGEETQLSGIIAQLDLANNDDVTFIMPGTHSKHIAVADHQIKHFNTFMTGEIFEVLTRHSILSHAVKEPSTIEINDAEEKAFREGVLKGLRSPLLNALFSVRIKQLKKVFSEEDNYFYMSGLLIGSELQHVQHTKRLVLCSSGNLRRIYQMAIECAGMADRTQIISDEMLNNAAAIGQLQIFLQVKEKPV